MSGGPTATVDAPRPPDDVSVVAQADKKAARILARSLAQQAGQRAAAQRREAQAQVALEREAAAARKAEAKAQAAQARRAKWSRRGASAAQRVGRVVSAARREAAAVYSLGVYAAVVYVAATSQAQVAREQFGWSWSRAAGAAIFIEGASLAFALTAHRQRLNGERARIAVAMTWAAALFGAGMNYLAHAFDPNLSPLYAQLQAIALAVSSLLGIILWETRSGARTGAAQRSLGLDYWLRFPRAAFWAWSATIADHRIRTREDAITAGEALHAAYVARRDRAAAHRRAEQAEKVFVKAARRAAKVAAKNGDPGPALSYLGLLAQQGPSVLAARPLLTAAPSTTGPDHGGPPAASAEQRAGQAPEAVQWPTTAGCDCGEALHRMSQALHALTAALDSWADPGERPTDEPTDPGHEPTNGPDGGSGAQWQRRLDELDRAYRADDGTELPLPGRRAVIAMMSVRAGMQFRWTNHSTVNAAIRDLTARRGAAPDGAGNPCTRCGTA